MKVSWLEPIETHGHLKRYIVSYGTARDNLDVIVYTTSARYFMTSLEEFTDYYVQVYAEAAVSGKRTAVKHARTLEEGERFCNDLFSFN